MSIIDITTVVIATVILRCAGLKRICSEERRIALMKMKKRERNSNIIRKSWVPQGCEGNGGINGEDPLGVSDFGLW